MLGTKKYAALGETAALSGRLQKYDCEDRTDNLFAIL
jgi:hypothetical protein